MIKESDRIARRPFYYKTTDIIELFEVSKSTVMQWIYKGKLPAFKVGGQYRIRKEAVRAFMKDYVPAAKQATPAKIGRPKQVTSASGPGVSGEHGQAAKQSAKPTGPKRSGGKPFQGR